MSNKILQTQIQEIQSVSEPSAKNGWVNLKVYIEEFDDAITVGIPDRWANVYQPNEGDEIDIFEGPYGWVLGDKSPVLEGLEPEGEKPSGSSRGGSRRGRREEAVTEEKQSRRGRRGDGNKDSGRSTSRRNRTTSSMPKSNTGGFAPSISARDLRIGYENTVKALIPLYVASREGEPFDMQDAVSQILDAAALLQSEITSYANANAS